MNAQEVLSRTGLHSQGNWWASHGHIHSHVHAAGVIVARVKSPEESNERRANARLMAAAPALAAVLAKMLAHHMESSEPISKDLFDEGMSVLAQSKNATYEPDDAIAMLPDHAYQIMSRI